MPVSYWLRPVEARNAEGGTCEAREACFQQHEMESQPGDRTLGRAPTRPVHSKRVFIAVPGTTKGPQGLGWRS
jgi:hypothetical protein